MESSGSNRSRSLLDIKTNSPDPSSLAGLTLSAVLENHRPSIPTQAQANRTLFNLIRDDPSGSFRRNKKSWKLFREKIRLGRAGAAWVSSIRTPTSDVNIAKNNNNCMISRRNSVRIADDSKQEPGRPDSNSGPNDKPPVLRRNLSRTPSLSASPSMINRAGSIKVNNNNAAEPAENQPGVEVKATAGEVGTGAGAATEEGREEGPVKMSLMALLAETDGSSYSMDGDEEEEEEEEVENGSGYSNCCVCMVRHKVASCVACGHTFCRLCSRELSVQRGNCPLCNRFVSEILGVF